jgi:hypothetical protein
MKSVVHHFCLPILLLSLSACSVVEQLTKPDTAGTPIPPAKLYQTTQVSGAWIPAVPGTDTDPAPHSPLTKTDPDTITVTDTTYIIPQAGMVRYQDGWGNREVTLDLGEIDAEETFGYGASGGNGSITLTAETVNYPYSGGASPVLTSFKVVAPNSTVTEFVNLKTECSTQGMWQCGSSTCTENPNCTIQSPSSFFNRGDWDQHQIPNYGYVSVNTFPRCDSNVGGWTGCPATHHQLPSGHYYAKFILMSDRSLAVNTSKSDMKIRVTIKKDALPRNSTASNGAINLNVILVGNTNVNDSRLEKGALNLNLLFRETNRILKQAANVSIGKIRAYEWRDADDGDFFSQIHYSQLGILFSSGSQGVLQNDPERSINIFMVRDISSGTNSFSILGLAGAILGPPVNGAMTSGLAFSTNISVLKDVLSEFNTNCTDALCDRNSLDGTFLEMGSTIAHELGHYLGLNHPSEKVSTVEGIADQKQDRFTDTPTCKPRQYDNEPYLDQESCYVDPDFQPSAGTEDCQTACNQEIGSGQTYFNFNGSNYVKNSLRYCPLTTECQFNHLMWYTIKNRARISGQWREDGNMISNQSSTVIQWNPLVK